MRITFFVPGKPIRQGDLSANRQGRLYHTAHKELDTWRHNVAWRARKAMRENGFDITPNAVMMTLRFVLPRPKATAKTRATPPAIKKPDLDKLARAIGDALTAVVYVDDSQVVEAHTYKRLAEIDEQVGCEMEISEWEAG